MFSSNGSYSPYIRWFEEIGLEHLPEAGGKNASIGEMIQKLHQQNTTIGFCGQAPSDDATYATFLVEAGIDSISLNPDSVAKVVRRVAVAEQRGKIQNA